MWCVVKKGRVMEWKKRMKHAFPFFTPHNTTHYQNLDFKWMKEEKEQSEQQCVLPSQSITFLLLLHFVLSFTSPLVPFAFKLITNEVRELNLKAKQTRTWWMSCSFVFLLLTWMVMKCNVSTHSSEKKKNTKRTTENTTFFVSFIRLVSCFLHLFSPLQTSRIKEQRGVVRNEWRRRNEHNGNKVKRGSFRSSSFIPPQHHVLFVLHSA